MRTKLLLIAAFAAVLVGSLAAKGLLVESQRSDPAEQAAGPETEPPSRIVSLSPSTTEILFALGLGDRVVGVTQYCDYPPEAKSKTLVGGYLNPKYETILALRPDLVVLRGEDQRQVRTFAQLGLRTLAVRHGSMEGILDSIQTIGRGCGAEAKAAQLGAGMQRQIDGIARRTALLDRPRVMIVVERDLGTGRVRNACIAGADAFMNRLIGLAGGQNACTQRQVVFPRVSLEDIVEMNPDVILDLVAERRQGDLSAETIVVDWRQLGWVEAVRRGRVHLVDDDYVFIPGPRLAQTIERLARLIHPELGWPP